MTVAAAIPVLNEAETIGQIVRDARRRVDSVLVIDDGSTDDGARIARQAGAEVISHDRNLGKGIALVSALQWARERADVERLVLLDGDGQHDPDQIPRMLETAQRLGVDILVGSRFSGTSNVPFYRVIGLHVLSAAAGLGSGIQLSDSQSGFRVLSRRAVDRLDLTEPGFAVEAEMQFLAARIPLKVGEMPISIRYAGPARRSPVVHGVSVLLRTLVLIVRYRPGRLPMLVAMPAVLWRLARGRRHATEEGPGA